MPNATKIIVTSKTNLKTKYTSDYSKVIATIRTLIKSDKKRQITSTLVFIDDTASMQKLGLTRVSNVSEKNCKKAIDEIYKSKRPDYLLIFGAHDIIPFQTLANPIKNDPEEDENVPSDLPYACEHRFSDDVTKFSGPTRVIGRLPDIPVIGDLAYVKRMIAPLLNYKKKKKGATHDCFVISANVWRSSTNTTISNIFQPASSVHLSPPDGHPYTPKVLGYPFHFYNCHGSPDSATFLGQKFRSSLTIDAINSAELDKFIKPFTIAAAECCYGSCVFDPAEEDFNRESIPNTYFRNKALAFLGSSTIAYGEFTGQSAADLMCEYFLKGILKGASTGRALLDARQKFVSNNDFDSDPMVKKTLAQFMLLGDPSVQIIETGEPDSKVNAIKNRRMVAASKGMSLQKNHQNCKLTAVSPGYPSMQVKPSLKSILRENGFTGSEEQCVYKLTRSPQNTIMSAGVSAGKNKSAIKKSSVKPIQNNITVRTFKKKKKSNAKVPNFEVMYIKEQDGLILDKKLYSSK
ncbi:MAG TPA: hypothetical protein VFG10_15830 [Saprospiraceae bacterium]|nr:hypothetical protein [Saprospiraceae bacterium]